jgi:hypothetical protein
MTGALQHTEAEALQVCGTRWGRGEGVGLCRCTGLESMSVLDARVLILAGRTILLLFPVNVMSVLLAVASPPSPLSRCSRGA